MSGKGASKGNQFAKKERSGMTTSIYITVGEKTILEESLRRSGVELSTQNINAEARNLMREAIAREGRRQKKMVKTGNEEDTAA